MIRDEHPHVIATRTAWAQAGGRIVWGPVGATGYGPLPQQVYRRGVFGALGIVDGRLVFEGQRSHRADLSVPLAQIQRIGLVTVPVGAARLTRRRRALAVHFTEPDGWRVALLVPDDPGEVAATLSRECGLPLHDSGPARDDYGPAPAVRMQQDVYGAWSEDRAGILYLAPDRLLFDWRDELPLSALRRIDVIAADSLLERLRGRAGLLRIEYADAAGDFAVTGFAVPRAGAWAAAIRARASEPVPLQARRKKKREER